MNGIINKLPIELHVPGYQYCGPGTKLAKRLSRGDPGVNALDRACKEHDIAYSKNPNNLPMRHEADKKLAEKAALRLHAKDASLSEKAVAWGVNRAMRIKRSLGMGMCMEEKFKKLNKYTRNKSKKPLKNGLQKTMTKGANKKVTMNKIINKTKRLMGKSIEPIKSALQAARKSIKEAGGKKNIRIPRIIPIPPKIGGVLPFLIPLFAGLSATGALAGGAAGIAKAVNDASMAKSLLAERKRHNTEMEEIAMGKGLYLRPYKQGLGLYLNQHPKNF